MNSNISILEIRKIKFIENPNYDNFQKLAEKLIYIKKYLIINFSLM